MNKRLSIILFFAFGIAAIGSLVIWRMEAGRTQAQKPQAISHLLAIKENVKQGTLLTAENLSSIDVVGQPPKEAILVADQQKAINRGVVADMYQGETVIESRLAPVGSGAGIAPLIPIGMRAVAVHVDEVVNVSGFVSAGMHVDVVISGIPPDPKSSQTQDTQARTLLQNVTVLSAGMEYQKDVEGKPKQQVTSVNLLVTPEQAEKLALTSNAVRIQLVLRNPLDTKTDPVIGIDQNSLFAGDMVKKAPAPKAAVHKAAPGYSIEVMNGSKTSTETFATPGGHQ